MSNTNTIESASDLLKIYEADESSKRNSLATNNPRVSVASSDVDDNTGSEILDTYSQMVRRDISDDSSDVGSYSDDLGGSFVERSAGEEQERDSSHQYHKEEQKEQENSHQYHDEQNEEPEKTHQDQRTVGDEFGTERESFDAEDARSGFIQRSSSPSKTVRDPEYSDSDSDSDFDDANDGFDMPDDSGFDVPDLDEEEDRNEPIFDDNGSVIDIPQKKRVVSTYSEVGSTWNAFPNLGNNDDVQTIITDVKTIYDNNTLMNVPLASQSNLPPLPKLETLDLNAGKLPPLPEQVTPREEEEEEEEDMINRLNNAKDVITGPDDSSSLPFSSLNRKKKFPEVSIMQVIQNQKISNDEKLAQLKNYSQELAEYDTGVLFWINNTLKSNSELKLKENYVMNKHVKEAYSNAEQLSKRNNSHLVSDLNQNMQQLTKKVFNSSMRGKSKSFLKSLREKAAT